MGNFLSSIEYTDPVWIAVAFLFGVLSRFLGLPPLVGFLFAGFLLNMGGAKAGQLLDEIANIGIILLLFTIGLKLRVTELLRQEIWAVTVLYTLIVSLLLTISLLLFRELAVPIFSELSVMSSLLIGFVLSFSSTVFIVKILDDRGDLLSQYGQLAIGVLIVQDIFAVLFMAVSESNIPSVWAIALILILILLRPVLIKLLNIIGHGELLVLYGLVLALGGGVLFELFNLKAELGALLMGLLFANQHKAEELANILFSLKELFLVGFFLSIGMAGLPDISMVFAILLLLVVLVFKSSLLYFLFTLFRVRSRPAIAASLILGNYSEFGLIITAVAISQGWLSSQWLALMAVLVASSFVISSLINNGANKFYAKYQTFFKTLQSSKLLIGDEKIDISGIKVIICGMGRVGVGAYNHLLEHTTKNILGLDFDERVVDMQCQNGRKTLLADVSNSEFWTRIDITPSEVEWIYLCAPNFETNYETAVLIREWGYKNYIGATTKYSDEHQELQKIGVNSVFNIYAEAGAGLALSCQESENEINKAK